MYWIHPGGLLDFQDSGGRRKFGGGGGGGGGGVETPVGAMFWDI